MQTDMLIFENHRAADKCPSTKVDPVTWLGGAPVVRPPEMEVVAVKIAIKAALFPYPMTQ